MNPRLEPIDESRRLQTLHTLDVLDTAADPVLDGVVRTAALALGCPISLVSLVDSDRQWFKAEVGLGVRQTPRETAFCAHTVLGTEPLVVPDAALDPRFAANPLVTGAPHIRFYAGIPLEMDGHAIGTLCVIDRQPRTLAPAQLAMLQDLARAVRHWMHGRRDHLLLRAREREFRELAEQIPAIVYRAALDADSSTLYVSPQVQMLGFSPEQWIARPQAWDEAIHPDDRDRVRAELRAALAAGDSVELEYRLRDAAGQWRHFRDVARRVLPAGADAAVLQGVMFDISDHVAAEQARLREAGLRRDQQVELMRLSAAVEQAAEAIVVTDLQGRIEYVNRAATETSGYAADELVGQPVRLLGSGHTPAETFRALWRAIVAGQTWRGFLFNRRKDGVEYVEQASIRPLRDDNGEVSHYIAVKLDVTENRRLHQELVRFRGQLDDLVRQRTAELEDARAHAEAASQAKSAFLAAMSHEIRTPMNGVIGVVDVLQRSQLTPYQQELAGTIGESGAALLQIIDDILDFSKIEAGRLELESVPFDLTHLVERACDALQTVAASRDVELRVFVDPAIVPMRIGDAARLRQIVNNLVGNAIKFSAGTGRLGRVALRVVAAARDHLRLEVVDNGIGIAAPTLKRLFEPFTQAEAGTTRKHGGTGLGLAISRRLVEAMDGSIHVLSEVDQGSTFSVELPLPALSGADTTVPGVSLAGLRCHLALAPDWAADLAVYLGAAGALVVTPADPGAAAVGDLVDVLISTPELIEAWPVRWPSVSLQRGLRRSARRLAPGQVVLDADALHRDALLHAIALAAGLVEFRHETAVPPAGDGAPPEVDTAQAAADGRLVLVAEDNEINRTVLQHQLACLGIAAEFVTDGAQALAAWRAGPSRYGLLLTDLHMPGLDGHELAAAIRADGHAIRRMPIVALTANALREEQQRCRDAGIDGFLTKPMTLEQLDAELRRFLPDPLPERAMAASPGPSESAGTGVEAEPLDFDEHCLPRLFRGDLAARAALQRAYLASVEQAVVEVARAVAADDWHRAGQVGHRMKSSSLTIGALRLGAIFDEIERVGLAGEGAAVRGAAQRLPGALRALRPLIVPTQAASVLAAGPRVIVIDDEPVQRAAIERQLGALGAPPVETCGSGLEALARLAAIDTAPVLLLVDLNMPGMDGIELIRHLAAIGFDGGLALVSGADRRVLDTGARLAQAYRLRSLGHLHKPVSTQALRELLQDWRKGQPALAKGPTTLCTPEALREALATGALMLHYQPQVSLHDGQLAGVEALVRWQHPHQGIVGPGAFVPVAEQQGMIDAVTTQVLELALAQQRRWREQHGLDLTVSVNVSMDNLTRLDFPEQVLALLAQHGVAPERLVLEVTESRLMNDPRAALDILARLRLRGVGLSIDDFGTGHSSLAQLRDLPFQELKVDRGFVHGGRSHATLRAILNASVEMAHELDMRVVAEGVEDQTDFDFAAEAGCNVAQGWFIARPMAGDALLAWVAQRGVQSPPGSGAA